MKLSKPILSDNNKEVINVKIYFKDQSNLKPDEGLEVLKHIFEKAAVDIVLQRYLTLISEKSPSSTPQGVGRG